MANLVGEKGQIVIEKPLRGRGALKKYATRVLSTDELREARDKAWEEAATKDWGAEGGGG